MRTTSQARAGRENEWINRVVVQHLQYLLRNTGLLRQDNSTKVWIQWTLGAYQDHMVDDIRPA